MGRTTLHDTNTTKHDTICHDTSGHERLAVSCRASTTCQLLGPCTTRTSPTRVVPARLARLARTSTKKRGANRDGEREEEEQTESSTKIKKFITNNQIYNKFRHKNNILAGRPPATASPQRQTPRRRRSLASGPRPR
jgi:hypothetical protein